MRRILVYLVLGVLLGIAAVEPAAAQLTQDQRVSDFQALSALLSKRYAPYEWKKLALKFDVLDLKPWLDRVRLAKDDLEFYEIEGEYIASLQDTHSVFINASSWSGSLGFTVDIYDGKVLIDTITRALLPVATFPFQIGDELVSLDSVSAQDWINRISTYRRWGNPTSTRRLAAGMITSRQQSIFPRAYEVGDSATVEIRRASGALERYTIAWSKNGLPLTRVGPVPTPKAVAPTGAASTDIDFFAGLDLHHYELPYNDPARGYVTGLGARAPIFQAGLPANFVQRLGRVGADFHFSGTFAANGLTLGYLRVPSFAPPSLLTAVNELRAEIDYFQKNTDGLVVDVMRNPGGGCYMIDLAAALTPYPFYFFGEQLRPTQLLLNSFYAQLANARLFRADQVIIDTLQAYYDEVSNAYFANRGITAPIPACTQMGQTTPPVAKNNLPASVVYTKPFIVLVDNFSISAADIFPAMIQDNERALLVGTRTAGGGGSVSQYQTGFYSESYVNNTNSLVVRKNPIVTLDYPAAPYVENIGARPDIALEYMTRDNLLSNGRIFVDQFTNVLLDQIKVAASRNPFTVANRGGVSFSTPEASGAPLVGYGRIKANPDNTPPAGIAIVGLRQNNVLVTEAAVSASPVISSGRMYAEVGTSVNTGIAMANPSSALATVSFSITATNGIVSSGLTTIPANGQIAAFLDQPPFNGPKPLSGSFTFSSNVPLAVTGLRGLTNERSEFLITTLPVSELSRPATATPVVFPQFADGNGWTTQIALVNPTDQVLTGSLVFYGQPGVTVTVTIDGQLNNTFLYSIPPRSSQTFKTAGTGDPTRVGSVRAIPSGTSVAPNGVAIFSFQKNGVTVAAAGVPAVSTGSAFRLYAEASGNFSAGAIGSIQTGVAITNSGATPATVAVELTRLDGTPTGLSGTVIVPSNGQVSQFLNEIPGLTSLQVPFQGLLRVSSSSPISVAGLRGRYNERADFLIAAMPAANESDTASTAELFFPHFVAAGGYTTQFVLFSGSTGQQSSGTLRLVSQSGEPVTLSLR